MVGGAWSCGGALARKLGNAFMANWNNCPNMPPCFFDFLYSGVLIFRNSAIASWTSSHPMLCQITVDRGWRARETSAYHFGKEPRHVVRLERRWFRLLVEGSWMLNPLC